MNRYNKLLKNSGIFAIANLGSHLISFLLVRFYTELLSSEQYGTIDFMVTTISMLIPFLTISIVEAVLRFSIDSTDKRSVFTNGLIVTIVGNFFFCTIGPLFFRNTIYEQYFVWMAVLVLGTSIDNVVAQFVRGIGDVKAFAIAGVLKTLTTVLSNLLFLLVLGWKIEGYMLSLIFAEFVSFLFLSIKVKLHKYIQATINTPVMKDMVSYSLPLMPNSLSWWVMNAADKYVIFAFLGVAANGMYAVAHKMPTLINICNNLFFQAWQLSAVEESESAEKNGFYSNVFSALAMVLFLAAALLLAFIKPLMQMLVSSDYGDVWIYSPFLIIAMVFSVFSSFLGTNYVAMKKTKGAFKTTVFGAVINLILNLLLTKPFGINGAAFATMFSFGATWLYRAWDTKGFVVIRYNIVAMVGSVIILCIQAIAIIFRLTIWLHIFAVFAMFGVHYKQLKALLLSLKLKFGKR